MTLYEEGSTILDTLLPSISKTIDFQKVNLYEDMKLGVNRIKKLKMEQKNGNSYKNSKIKYSLERPPQIFIRRAVESSDEEDESNPTHKEKNMNGGNKRKYKEVQKEKAPSKQPIFSNDDFPSLP